MSDHLLPIPWLDVLLILALVVLNGVLAMGELAIVSSREARLKALAKSGSRGAQCALDLASDPGRFLSTVQSGITLISIFAGAFSGASARRARRASGWSFSACSPKPRIRSASALVIVLTTYVSLVIGEIVPKQIALRSPEPIAVDRVAADALAVADHRPVRLAAERTSALIFRLLGLDRESKNQVTAEELHLVVAEAQTAGVLEEDERAMISGIVRLADRPVREVMTPRTEVDWIDVAFDAGGGPRGAARRPSTAGFPSPTDRSRISSASSRHAMSLRRCSRASRSTSSACAARRRSSPT